MKDLKLKLVLGAALTAAAFSASATTYNLGPLTGLYANNVPMGVGTISDKYTFDVASASPVVSASTYVTLPSFLDISGFKVELFTFSGSSLGIAAKDSNGMYVLNTGPLAAATGYYFMVTGTATGGNGGNYTFALAPVPEPASYAMLLAGLGMMGFVARRRLRQS